MYIFKIVITLAAPTEGQAERGHFRRASQLGLRRRGCAIVQLVRFSRLLIVSVPCGLLDRETAHKFVSSQARLPQGQ